MLRLHYMDNTMDVQIAVQAGKVKMKVSIPVEAIIAILLLLV